MAEPFLYMAVQDIQEMIDLRHALLHMLILLSGQVAQPNAELTNKHQTWTRHNLNWVTL